MNAVGFLGGVLAATAVAGCGAGNDGQNGHRNDDTAVDTERTDAAGETSPPLPSCAGLGAPCDALPPPHVSPTCGAIFREAPAAPFPARLSALGCLVPGDPHVPAEGVMRDDVAAPLFSEGSSKARFLSVPAASPLTPTDEGPWRAADGTVALKTFGFPITPDGAATPVEVRVMVRADGVWRFATYHWDNNLGDGLLADTRGEWVDVDSATADGEVTRLRWWIPGELGCRSCHGLNAPDLLAVSTRQLAFDIDAGHVIADQVVALAAAGWVTPPTADAPGSAMPHPGDAAAPIDARARAWPTETVPTATRPAPTPPRTSASTSAPTRRCRTPGFAASDR